MIDTSNKSLNLHENALVNLQNKCQQFYNNFILTFVNKYE